MFIGIGTRIGALGNFNKNANISSFYGTGVGQVPLHLAPEDAVLDASGAVLSVRNRGGAGPVFNASAGGATITRSGNMLQLGSSSAWLTLANPADLYGVRLFVIGQMASTSKWQRIASHPGNDPSSINDDNMVVLTGNGTLPDGSTAGATRVSVGNGTSANAVGKYPRNTSLALFEVECSPTGTLASAWNGGYPDTKTGAVSPGPFLLSRLFAGQISSADDWNGKVGDVVSLVIDGTTDLSPQIATIRKSLMSKYNLTTP